MAVPGGLSLEDAVKLVAAQGKSVSVPMAAAPTIAPERLPGPLQCSLFPFCYPQYCELSSGSAWHTEGPTLARSSHHWTSASRSRIAARIVSAGVDRLTRPWFRRMPSRSAQR